MPVSEKVNESVNKARSSLNEVKDTLLKGGAFKGVEANQSLFDGLADKVNDMEGVFDDLSALTAQASVMTKLGSFIPGVGKLNTLVNQLADPIVRLGDGGSKLLQNLFDLKNNTVKDMAESIREEILMQADSSDRAAMLREELEEDELLELIEATLNNDKEMQELSERMHNEGPDSVEVTQTAMDSIMDKVYSLASAPAPTPETSMAGLSL